MPNRSKRAVQPNLSTPAPHDLRSTAHSEQATNSDRKRELSSLELLRSRMADHPKLPFVEIVVEDEPVIRLVLT